jgi:hypothetical protein
MLPLANCLLLLKVGRWPLATKVTLKIIRWFFWQKISIESYPLPNKSIEISMAKFTH